MAGTTELCNSTVITTICKKSQIRANAEILEQLLTEFCGTQLVYSIQDSDVEDLGGIYGIDIIENPATDSIAITETLKIYVYDGNWTLKFAGLDDFIASGEDNGDGTYTFTSFDGSTDFTIQEMVLGETDETAYRGDRGKIAYDHSQASSGNPHGVTKSDVGLGSVDNTSDADKPVSTDQQTALDDKLDNEFLIIDENQIFSKRGLNQIAVPNKDLILSCDSTQPNKILGTSQLRSIVGGYDNTINDNIASSIVGSHHSKINGGGHMYIAGGSTNVINSGGYSAIIGGRNNTVQSTNQVFLGACQYSTVHGGGAMAGLCAQNLSIDPDFTGQYVFIAPSSGSSVSDTAGDYNAIIGGVNNSLLGSYGFIGQGLNNETSQSRSTILNGFDNQATRNESQVLNGQNNIANGRRSTIINGEGNTANSFAETVTGHYSENVAGNYAIMREQDRAFAVGIGNSDVDRKSALTVWKSGRNEVMFLKIRNVVPDTPEDGDVWFDGTDLKMQISSTIKTFTLT